MNEGIEVKAVRLSTGKGYSRHCAQITDVNSRESIFIDCLSMACADRLARRLKDVIEDGGAA